MRAAGSLLVLMIANPHGGGSELASPCCVGPRILITVALIAVFPTAQPAGLFEGDAPLVFTIRAPLQQLFDKGVNDQAYEVDGMFSVEGGTAVPVRVSVRGNTSKRDSECSFPKLKLHFDKKDGPDGVRALKIGSHCGENPGEELTGRFGRLANQLSPWREVTVYRLLAALNVPTLRARDARITYVDTSQRGTIVPSPLTRNALIVEDDDEAMKRLGATSAIAPEQFSTARDRFTLADTARIAFAEALIGNFDWCLAFSSDDTYRCDARRKLWNLLAVRRADGDTVPVMEDFDLAGPVVGRHIWFKEVYGDSFPDAGSPIEAEVLAQVQRTRTLFARDVLDAARHEFLGRRAEAYNVVRRANVDPHGRELAKDYLDAFYRAIDTDQGFYRPVVVEAGTHVFGDSNGMREACGQGDTVPVGTPVVELRRSGELAQVRLLDVMWYWTDKRRCDAVHTQPVWIPAAAISANYPVK